MIALPDGPIWSIGCGNMGGAMLRRWLETGLDPARVTVVTRSGRNVPSGVRSLIALPLDEEPAVLLLAVKPQQLEEVAPQVEQLGVPLLISILTGVELAALHRRTGAQAVVRMMPNLPVEIGEGVVALSTDSDDCAVREIAEALSRPLGLAEWIDDDAQFDAVTALAGCGPGFVFRFADALAEAGAALGLDPLQARRLAIATLAGAGRMAADSTEPPSVLADRVASPGGSTREGLNVLDRDGALADLMSRTVAAAARRNAELAAAAR